MVRHHPRQARPRLRGLSEQVPLLALLRDLRRRWRVALAVTLAVFAGGILYAESLPDQYTTSAVVAFSPKPDGNAGADTVRVVLPKYVAFATARATTNRVAPAIGERPRTLASAVDASVAADSGNLKIDVTLPAPRRAATAANALAAEVVSFAENDELLDAVIVAEALPSLAPSGPPRRLLQLATLIVGGLLGAAMAFLLERGRPRVRTWRDVSVATGYPVVGRVMVSRSLRDSPIEALGDPAVGAAVRTLRTNLETASRERPVRILGITSSSPGEGKTTLASALAIALARLDADILLVDADLRRPGLARAFRQKPEPGLAEVLRGESAFKNAVRRTPVARLSVLPTRPDPDAGDLLARNLGDVLRSARENYDVVVVDAPPILVGDDARTIATLCDGVLFVVASDSLATSVAEAASALDSLGVRVLGAVANRTRDSRLGSYAYGGYGGAQT